MSDLPKGLRIDHGYVQVRIQHNGVTYCRNFGPDSQKAVELATIHLAKKREEILLGKFGYAPEVPTKLFSEVAAIFFDRWGKQIDAEGRPKHTDKSIKNLRSFLDSVIVPYFGKMEFSSIRPVDVQNWRDKRVQTVLGTTANREQAVISSLFSHIETWVKAEQIKAFKIPAENPCEFIKFAQTRKRERVLSLQELGILKLSCGTDSDLWEICRMALKSMLRPKDLMRLEAGQSIDMTQAKTGHRINLPMQVLKPLNYVNFRNRWESVRKSSGLIDVQFRDLRKTGANLLKQKNWSNKIISEVLGHTTTRTTEIYLVPNLEHLKQPLNDLSTIVDAI